VAILDGRHESKDIDSLQPVASLQDITNMVNEAAAIYAAPSILEYIVSVATATRQQEEISLGVSPRATVALLKASRVSAAVAGRTYVTPQDVRELIVPVFAHRLQLSGLGVQRRRSVNDVLQSAIANTPVPRPATT
jgi:MoxR-like ATPase